MLDALFRELFKAPPNAWQRAAYNAFLAGTPPQYIKVPTAGGKTAILAVFLAALAEQARTGTVTLPRRLVLVVNRRVLVDQASALAQRLSEIVKAGTVPELSAALTSLSTRGIPLAVSTLRGAMADNGDWSLDPTTPGLILGTPDMIGSRLLFRGYGIGRSRAATHAGLLGIDTLVVHDEAHLAPAFSAVLREIEALARPSAIAVGRPPLHVLEMTATLPPQAKAANFLECAIADDPALAKRMSAPKWLKLVTVDVAQRGKPAALVLNILAERALAYAGACKAVALFVNRPDAAAQLAERLLKGGVPAERIVPLTGTLRGWEREQLTRTEGFLRFSPDRTDEAAPTAYFLCTSAGEIGLDIDADVGLMDLVTLDRVIQRAGRVNRRGSQIGELILVHAEGNELDGPLLAPSLATLALLNALDETPDGRDASPLALSRLTDDPQYATAIPPTPPRRGLEPAILAQWAMTALRLDALRVPAPDLFLHGLDDNDLDVDLVWRQFPCDAARLPDWFEAWPVLRHERARLPLFKARNLIEALWAGAHRQDADAPAFVILDSQGRVIEGGVFTGRNELRRIERQVAPGRTVVIRQNLGGLSPAGLPDAEHLGEVSDVSAEGRGRIASVACVVTLASGEAVWRHGEQEAADLPSLVTAAFPALKVVFAEEVLLPSSDLLSSEDATVQRQVSIWLQDRQIESPDAGERASFGRCDRTLAEHLDLARKSAQALLQHLPLSPGLADIVESAAARHDVGKQDARWQTALGNTNLAVPLAKSRRPAFDVRFNDGYRHELGSVVMLDGQLSPLERHLVAAHHGWARPGFSEKARAKPGSASAADQIAQSFVHLNACFGLWGVAYLEALVKSADVLAELDAERLAAAPATESAQPLLLAAPAPSPNAVEIPADPRNFGEYLACLGLLGLLASRQPDLSAMWTAQGFRLLGVSDSDVLAAVDRLLTMEIHLDESALRPTQDDDKFPPLQLRFGEGESPILLNNWLRPDFEEKSAWKLSAGQTGAVSILRGLRAAALQLRPQLVSAVQVLQLGTTMKERFRFDAGTSWSALDAGFTLNEDDRFSTVRVFLELLSILGVQHAFAPPADREPFRYMVWQQALPATLCLLAAKGLLPGPSQTLVPRRVPSGQMKDIFTSELTLAKEVSPCLPTHLIV